MKLMRIEGPTALPLSPLAAMQAWSNEISRLFGGSLADGGRVSEVVADWLPPLDLREEKDDFVVTVELPGVNKDEIQVAVRDGVLMIEGQRAQEELSEDAGILRQERCFGRFRRSILLPKAVAPDGVRAVYRDGLLTVRLAKPEEAKPRRIQVSVA